MQIRWMTRLGTTVGSFPLRSPVICGSGEPVMTEAGIRAAVRAGAAGVVAKSVNEHPAGGRQLDRADYVRLDADGTPTAGQGVSLGAPRLLSKVCCPVSRRNFTFRHAVVAMGR